VTGRSASGAANGVRSSRPLRHPQLLRHCQLRCDDSAKKKKSDARRGCIEASPRGVWNSPPLQRGRGLVRRRFSRAPLRPPPPPPNIAPAVSLQHNGRPWLGLLLALPFQPQCLFSTPWICCSATPLSNSIFGDCLPFAIQCRKLPLLLSCESPEFRACPSLACCVRAPGPTN
jgi:hypothetical protein